jgi:hypothetical protein
MALWLSPTALARERVLQPDRGQRTRRARDGAGDGTEVPTGATPRAGKGDEPGVAPHITRGMQASQRRSAIDGRTTRDGSCTVSQRKRELVEEIFGLSPPDVACPGRPSPGGWPHDEPRSLPKVSDRCGAPILPQPARQQPRAAGESMVSVRRPQWEQEGADQIGQAGRTGCPPIGCRRSVKWIRRPDADAPADRFLCYSRMATERPGSGLLSKPGDEEARLPPS